MSVHMRCLVRVAGLVAVLVAPAIAEGPGPARSVGDERRAGRLAPVQRLQVAAPAQPLPAVLDGWTWLTAHQNPSGTWGSAYEFVDTCTVAQTLQATQRQGTALTAAVAWLGNQTAPNFEYLARQIIALAAVPDQVRLAADLADHLMAQRNPQETDDTRPNYPEGGWGLAAGYATDCMTTALALRALRAVGVAGGMAVQNQAVTSNLTQTHAFELPPGVVKVRMHIVTQGVAVSVRIKAGTAPPDTDPYFQVAADASLDIVLPDDGPPVVPGTNYITVKSSGSGNYSIHVSCQTAYWDTRTLWDPYNTAGQGFGPLEYLIRSQNADGGWGLQRGQPTEFYTTLHVLGALQDYAIYGLASQRAAAVNYIKSQQLAGGGFGYDGAALPYVTALAMLELVRSETYPYSTAVQNAAAALRAMQSADGSWSQEPYDTALALLTLYTHSQPPSVSAGNDQWVIDTDEDMVEVLWLSAAASDIDGTIQRYVWSEAGQPLATGPDVPVNLPRGRHTIELTVTDDAGRMAADTVEVIVSGPIATFYQQNMDANPGWSVEGFWGWGVPMGLGGTHGGADPTAGYTGVNVYGYNLYGGYENFMGPTYLTTTPIDCSGQVGVRLRFRRWLCIEEAKYDHASVQVSNNAADPNSWVTVWEHTGGTLVETAWSLQEYDISAVADGQPTVYVRWSMGPTDEGWTWGGWNIDDVELAGGSITTGPITRTFYRQNMDTNPGWTTQGNWAWGAPTGKPGTNGGADPTGGYTGTNVYGYNLNGGYENNMTPTYLTTTAINCASYVQVRLRFRRWLCIEEAKFDHASVQVSNNPADPGSWVTVWEHTGGTLVETAWSLQEYDISAVADGKPAVYIRWVMGPTDAGMTWGGWNIDDVELIGRKRPSEVFYRQSLDTDPGWAAQGNWAWGVPTGGQGDHGGADPTSGYTGSHVYGYNLNGGYENYMSAKYLTTTAINCAAHSNVRLRFRRWLCIEESKFDHASVQVSNNPADPGSWVTLWNHSGGTLVETAWSLQDYDISAVADRQPAVYIRWSMGPTDEGWTWGGWNIDDVELVGIRQVPALPGDINGDGKVNVFDLQRLAQSWNKQQGQAGYDPACDLTGDNKVNVFDLQVMAQNWNKQAE